MTNGLEDDNSYQPKAGVDGHLRSHTGFFVLQNVGKFVTSWAEFLGWPRAGVVRPRGRSINNGSHISGSLTSASRAKDPVWRAITSASISS